MRIYVILQARLAELETPKKMEHLHRLEELKKRLAELEKQVSGIDYVYQRLLRVYLPIRITYYEFLQSIFVIFEMWNFYG